MSHPNLHHFDLWSFLHSAAQADKYLEGRLSLSDLPRLLVEKVANANDEAEFEWSLQAFVEQKLGQTNPSYFMKMTLKAEIWLGCQRCLEPYLQPLPVEMIFEVVQTQAQADAAEIDDDVDAVVGSHQFDLLDLIEEELLLALPLVPRHEACSHPALLRLRKEFEAFDEVKGSPFAALADLQVKQK